MSKHRRQLLLMSCTPSMPGMLRSMRMRWYA